MCIIYAICCLRRAEVHQKSLIIASLAKVLVTPPIKSSRRETDESHRRFLEFFHGMSYATENIKYDMRESLFLQD